MELLAAGRTAEVFAYGDGRVLKLDRPEWNGLAPFEGNVLAGLAQAGLPVARVDRTVRVEGRTGIVLDRVDGPPLADVLATARGTEIAQLAERFAALQLRCNAASVEGLPDLVPRLRSEIEVGIVDPVLRSELESVLAFLDVDDDGNELGGGSGSGRGVCHYDFHPGNVLVGPQGWVVIDWLTVANGPSAADLARTLVLWGRRSAEPVASFLRAVRRFGRDRRGLGDDTLDAWVRVVAAARVAEGFEGEERAWLEHIAGGSVRLCA
jgi:Ser/Thr protein kinase RdoA (MazF antagonist)